MSEQQNLNQFKRYLTNNQNLIQDKYQQYFKNVNNPTLHNIPVQTLIEFIYDIFCISKYKQDPKTNQKINQSLQKNIHDYLQMYPSKNQQKFTPQTAVQMLMFCIKNNDIFHVQYDPKDKNPQNQKSNNNQHQNQLNVQVKKQQNKDKVQQLPKSQQLDPQESEVLRSRVKGIANPQQEQPNQFDSSPQRINFSITSDLIKKNAKLAFLNFCKNQMQVGGRKTFDQLQEQASTMTIGKLLVYAKTYGMLNHQITKQMLMRKFKIISEGKRSINFEKYYTLLTELVSIDSSLIERLELNDENLYKKVKFANYPFHTQDQNPREMIAHRNFTHKITSHSGKTQEQLRQDLQARKLSHQQPLGHLKSHPKHYFKQDLKPRAKQKFLSPKDLSSGAKSRDYSIELSFIDKIVSPQDNDQKYLGDHQIDHYTRKIDQTALSNVMLRRKGSIVDNIRKRIQQIQNHENSKGSKLLSRRYQGY